MVGLPGADEPGAATHRKVSKLRGALEENSLMRIPIARTASRYALAPLFTASAVLVSLLARPLVPPAVEYLFLGAVVSSAWFGGRGPGLLAAILAPFTLDYFFLPPLHTFGIDRAVLPYILPFVLTGMGAAWMSSIHGAERQSREKLLHNEEKMRRLLANLPDISWTMDQDRRVVYMSPKIAGVLGYTSEEIREGAGDLLRRKIHHDDYDCVNEAWNELFHSDRPFNAEYRIQAKDGSWIWVHNRAIRTYEDPVEHFADGLLRRRTVYADGLLTDITARKQAEIDLKSKTALLEALVNSTIDGILVVDPAGHRLLQNRRMDEIFNMPPELIDQDDVWPAIEYATKLMKDGAAFQARLRYLQSNPEEAALDEIELRSGTSIDRYSAPVKDRSGKHYGRIFIFRDMTQRKRSEAKLRQLSTAVEQSPVAVVITDTSGNMTYVNRKFTEGTGYTLEEAIGKNPRILNTGHSPREVYAELWDTILQGREWHGEFCNKKKNGEIFWEAATITPIFDEKNNITHFLAVKEDITERRALESELRQAQKLEGIGQLAAGIAHEINTPTQFVTDNLTFLKESWDSAFPLLALYRTIIRENVALLPEEAAAKLASGERQCDMDFIGEEVPHAIAQSLDGARRVASIVRAMKEFSHPDSADKTETDLNRAIESTIIVARNEWRYVAEVVTRFDETLPPVVCYPGEVNQVILNIVVNAAHSIREKLNGKGRGTITICTRQREELAEIAISDTGTGIPEHIQTRIYEPFFTTKEVGTGTGQGLALAHSVVTRKHQGKIWFETEIGKGTTFFIHLPIGETPDEAAK